jgi:transcriptional regulator with XRE-family HTH domain
LSAEQDLDHVGSLKSLGTDARVGVVFITQHGEDGTREREPMSSKKSRERDLQQKSALAARIRSALGKREQKWLAAATGQPKSVISDYIRGRRTPGPDHLANLARALVCDPGWLLTGEEAAVGGSPPRGPVQAPTPGYERIPLDLWGDDRLLKAIDELVDILRGPDRKAAEWVLGNIQVFAERARAQMEPRRRRKAG